MVSGITHANLHVSLSMFLLCGPARFVGSADPPRTNSTARPLKYHFLQAAHVDKLRSGQLEVVEVNDLAMANLDGVLEGKRSLLVKCRHVGSFLWRECERWSQMWRL